MALPDELSGLLTGRPFPHPCERVELVETHISWVLLAGEFAYKIKRPVRFSFVDFSTLERREYFCREELRHNRQFAPDLYLDVVPLTRATDGGIEVDGAGPAVEWAVCMRRFADEAQLDRLLEADALPAELLGQFGRRLARQHAGLPGRRFDAEELDSRVLGPATDNFRDLADLQEVRSWADTLDEVRRGTEAQADGHRRQLLQRLTDGTTRECHGDLHLANLVRLEDGVVAFDCLEFNATLRWIDPQSDVAFLFMDCCVRDRADLGYAFVDGYLDVSGDYDGARLLPFYAAYRSMVRAKVAALGLAQSEDRAQVDRLTARFATHTRWTAGWLARGPGRLVLMCGLSASGKSRLAARLVQALPALRLRSDVARKTLAGIDPRRSAATAVGTGLYDPAHGDEVYDWLEAVAGDLLASGEQVIVDAAFLDPGRRQRFLELADRIGQGGTIVYCDAPPALLRERIRRRARRGDDPSDADVAVLEAQRSGFQAPVARTVRVDTSDELSARELTELARRLRGA